MHYKMTLYEAFVLVLMIIQIYIGYQTLRKANENKWHQKSNRPSPMCRLLIWLVTINWGEPFAYGNISINYYIHNKSFVKKKMTAVLAAVNNAKNF